MIGPGEGERSEDTYVSAEGENWKEWWREKGAKNPPSFLAVIVRDYFILFSLMHTTIFMAVCGAYSALSRFTKTFDQKYNAKSMMDISQFDR